MAVWRDYTLSNLLLAKFAAGQWDELEPVLYEEGGRSTNVAVVTAGVEAFIRAARGEHSDDVWDEDGSPPASDDPSIAPGPHSL